MRRGSVCHAERHRLIDKRGQMLGIDLHAAVRSADERASYDQNVAFSLSSNLVVSSPLRQYVSTFRTFSTESPDVMGFPMSHCLLRMGARLLLFSAVMCYGCLRSANVSARHVDGRGWGEYSIRSERATSQPLNTMSIAHSRWL